MIKLIKNFRRQDFLSLLIFIGISIILYRCINLQYFETDNWVSSTEAREIKPDKIIANRGVIVDRNNEILAESILLDTLGTTEPKFFLKSNSEKKIRELCNIIEKKYDVLKTSLLTKKNKKFVFIGRQLSEDQVNKINELKLRGVDYQKEFQRFYPWGESIGNLVGKTDKDHIGQSGLEKSYDAYLNGIDGIRKVRIDRYGKIVDNITILSPAEDGKKLTLTIDARLQYVAYRELKSKIKEVNAKSGSVIILDTTNGDILASASYPSYDPNDKNAYSNFKERNRGIIDPIEPASTIKPFLLTAALYSGSITLNQTFDTNPGYLKIGGHKYKDFKNYGLLTSEDVVIKSSNVGSVKISQKFNKKIYHDLLEYIGVGDMVNIKFPSEQSGKLLHFSEWDKKDTRSHAIGYALTMTPLQIAKAYSVIANQGMVINPRINKDSFTIKDESKKYKDSFTKVRKVIKKVVETGTGKKASLKGYTVGGKTGTAEVYNKKYNKNKHNSLFAGIIPISKPKLVIVVVINEPENKPNQFYGSFVSAPVFKRIASDSLRILNISPDNILDNTKRVSNKLENFDITTIKTPEDNYVF